MQGQEGDITQGGILNQSTVYLVDADPETRAKIVMLLSSIGIDSKTFDSAEHFSNSIEGSLNGCVISEVRFPGMNGLQLQQHLIERQIFVPFIFLTAFAEVPMVVTAMKHGAFDFVEKPFSAQALLDIIQMALESGAERQLEQADFDKIQEKLDSLSRREFELFGRLTAGKQTKEIAYDLNIGETTVDFHRRNLLNKMGVSNVVELTRLRDHHERIASRRAEETGAVTPRPVKNGGFNSVME